MESDEQVAAIRLGEGVAIVENQPQRRAVGLPDQRGLDDAIARALRAELRVDDRPGVAGGPAEVVALGDLVERLRRHVVAHQAAARIGHPTRPPARLAGQTALSADQNEQLNQLYDAIVALGLADNPLPEANPNQRGRPKKTKSRNLLERFVKHKEAILRFAHDVKVPFDNNLAERDIRMMKLQQKISGCFRSLEGAEQFCRLRSYISTIRKQGLSVWEALGSLFNGEVLIPQLTPV